MGLDALWVFKSAMNREVFDAYVETQLVPTLRASDMVILDNLSSHKSAGAATTRRALGARFLFRPPDSPDLNPELRQALLQSDPLWQPFSRDEKWI